MRVHQAGQDQGAGKLELLLAEARGHKGKWAVLNTRSSVEPFLTYSDRRDLREKVWRTFTSRGDNGDAHDTNATITITNSAGQSVYSGNYSLQQGNASFVWDGKGNDGTQWPAGTYTLTATGKDSQGNNVAISTEVQGVVDSVDLTDSPPLLSIGGQTYTTDQIKRVVRPSSSTS